MPNLPVEILFPKPNPGSMAHQFHYGHNGSISEADQRLDITHKQALCAAFLNHGRQ